MRLSLCLVLFFVCTALVSRFIPIEISNFVGYYVKNKKQIKLSWQTKTESDVKNFLIERQKPVGDNWDMLGFVVPQPPKGAFSYYEFTDVAPPPSTIGGHYRLRLIDNIGKSTLSHVITVAKDAGPKLEVFPTIVRDSILNLEGFENLENREGGLFRIYNLVGQPVLNGKAKPQIDVSILREGNYIIKVGMLQAKFVKQ